MFVTCLVYCISLLIIISPTTFSYFSLHTHSLSFCLLISPFSGCLLMSQIFILLLSGYSLLQNIIIYKIISLRNTRNHFVFTDIYIHCNNVITLLHHWHDIARNVTSPSLRYYQKQHKHIPVYSKFSCMLLYHIHCMRIKCKYKNVANSLSRPS